MLHTASIVGLPIQTIVTERFSYLGGSFKAVNYHNLHQIKPNETKKTPPAGVNPPIPPTASQITTVLTARKRISYSACLPSVNPCNLITVSPQPTLSLSPNTDHTPIFLNNPQTFKQRKGLGLIHLNVRSLLCHDKLDHIKILLSQTDADILVVSESWLKESVTDSSVALDHYNIFRCDRVGKGGGVAIYVKSKFKVSVLKTVSIPKCFELLILKVALGKNNSLCVAGVYRPPSADSNSIDNLAEILSPCLAFELIVMGDFNLDWLSNASNYLKEVSGNLTLSQLVTEPTRPNPRNYSRSTLIDLIFSNKSNRISACGVFDQGVSDHCPTACIRSMQLPKTKSHTVIKRNFKNFDCQAFLNDLAY